MASNYGQDDSQSLADDSSDSLVPPVEKRIKLELPDDCGDDVYKSLYISERQRELSAVASSYTGHNAELFFLENNGNFMDYFAWRKRPNTALNNFLESRRLSGDSSDVYKFSAESALGASSSEVKTPVIDMITPFNSQSSVTTAPQTTGGIFSQQIPQKGTIIINSNVAFGATSSSSTAEAVAGSSSRNGDSTVLMPATPQAVTVTTEPSTPRELVSANTNVEIAKQEAEVLKRVSELRKNGMWSEKRLPRILEPSRPKSQWDYVLEEMQWMAVDFAQERKWKICAAKQLANCVVKYRSMEEMLHRAERKLEEKHLKRKAKFVSGAVEDFWADMNKVALHNHHEQMELEQERYARAALVEPLDMSDDEEEDLSEDETSVDWNREVAQLIDEAIMPIEKLLEKYVDSSVCLSEVADRDQNVNKPSEDEIESRSSDVIIWNVVSQVSRSKPTSSSVLNTQESLNSLLKPYQAVAVDWMKGLVEGQKCGWMLGDESGLGKKAQIISLLQGVAQGSGVWGPHLIITPSNTLLPWYRRFLTLAPSFKIQLYFGSTLERSEKRKCWEDMNECHVCLTTYQVLLQDLLFFKSTQWKALILSELDKLKSLEQLEPFLSLSYERAVLLCDGQLSNRKQQLSAAECLLVIKLLFPSSCREKLEAQLLKDSQLGADVNKQPIIVQQLIKVIEGLSLCRTRDEVKAQLCSVRETIVTTSLSQCQSEVYTHLIASRLPGILSTGSQIECLELIRNLQLACILPDVTKSLQSSGPLHVCLPSCAHLSELTNVCDKRSVFEVMDCSRYLDLIDLELNPVHNVRGRPIRKSTAPPLIVDITTEKSAPSSDTFSLNISDEHRLLLGSLMDSEFLTCIYTGTSGMEQQSTNEMYTLEEEPLASTKPLYGSDLRSSVEVRWRKEEEDLDQVRWKGVCLNNSESSGSDEMCAGLQEMLSVAETGTNSVKLVKSAVVEPKVIARLDDEDVRECDKSNQTLKQLCLDSLKHFSAVHSSSAEIKCSQVAKGKLAEILQTVHRLKSEGKRVLMMSSFSAVLDLLEHVLDVHYLPYLRYDNSGSVTDQLRVTRQFNMDKRVTCLLSSTRFSSLLSLNPPDVDALLIIDTDWRPSFSGAVNHFITGLSNHKNITVHRFLTEGTVDEILKLSDSATYLLQQFSSSSDGSTAYTQDVIRAMFNNSSVPVSDILQSTAHSVMSSSTVNLELLDSKSLEMAMHQIEDNADSSIADVIYGYNENLLQEFSGKVLLSDSLGNKREITSSLSMIEQYALSVIKNEKEEQGPDTLLVPEPVKQSTSPERLETVAELKKKFIQYVDDGDDVMMFTYTRDRDDEQTFIMEETGEEMPIWTPPTPPHDDTDLYEDPALGFLYGSTPIPESDLPPIHVKKGHKKMKLSHVHATKQNHIKQGDHQTSAPRSLFDCPQLMLRYDSRLVKLGQGQQMALKQHFKVGQGQLSGVIGGRAEPPQPDHPDWLIHEDWALLQAFQLCVEIPAKSTNASSAFLPNWEFISDVVNFCSRAYRSAKQARNRYDNFILPREEGRLAYEISPRKTKKANKGLFKTKSSRTMRTNQLYVQDNNKASTTMFMLRFDAVKGLSSKRCPSVRPMLVTPGSGATKNTKHAAVLQESGITYDQPLPPLHVAAVRAERERTSKEKTKSTLQAVTSAAAAGDSQQIQQQQAAHVAQQLALQQQQTTSAAGQLVLQAAGQQLVAAAQNPQMALVQAVQAAQQIQAAVGSAGSAVASTAIGGQMKSGGVSVNVGAVVSGTSGVGMTAVRGVVPGGIVVNPGNPQTFSINKVQAINAGQTVRTVRQVAGLKEGAAAAAAGGPLAQVITSLSTGSVGGTQLLVTQRPAATMSQIGAAQQQQLLGLAAGTKAASLQQLQVRHRPAAALPQVRQTHLTAVQFPTVAAAAAAAAGTVAGGSTGQKTVAAMAPLVTSLSQAQISQLKGGNIPDIFKRTGLTPQAKGVTGVGPGQRVQQIQVSKNQVLEGLQLQPQLQAMPVASAGMIGTGSQTVATLIKTVTSGGAGVPSLSIPVSAVNIGNLSLGKVGKAPQIRQFQVQKRPTMVQLPAGQHRVTGTALQQVVRAGAGSTGSVILQPSQKVLVQPVSQPISQLLKQQPNVQLATAAGAASIATQLGANQVAGLVHAGPRSVSVALANPGVAGPSASLPANLQPQQSVGPATAVVNAATMKLLTAAGGVATLIKPGGGVKDSLLAVPQQRINAAAAGVQPVTIRSPVAAPAGPQTTIIQSGGVRAAMPQIAAAAVSQGVQQAVQEVVLAATAQAQLASRQQLPASSTPQAAVLLSPAAAAITSATVTGQSPAADKSTNYHTRLRNQRS